MIIETNKNIVVINDTFEFKIEKINDRYKIIILDGPCIDFEFTDDIESFEE